MKRTKPFDRGLTDEFVKELKGGSLLPILDAARSGHDGQSLDFQIRGNYINLYIIGRSVLKLKGIPSGGSYYGSIDSKYLEGVPTIENAGSDGGDIRGTLVDDVFISWYCHNLPRICDNALAIPKEEGRVEQAIIAANRGDDTAVHFIDRQIQRSGDRSRLDLLGLLADGTPVLTELKQGLDSSIQDLTEQMGSYRQSMTVDNRLRSDIAESYSRVVKQKQALGFCDESVSGPPPDAKVLYLVVLYDYNPNSKLKGRFIEAALKSDVKIHLTELVESHYKIEPMEQWVELWKK